MPGIGDSLRAARQARGLSHEYISQSIKIRPEFLAALENERYSALPGSFYTRNFLRRYAEFLGLDSASLLEQYSQAEAASEQPAFAVTPARSRSVSGGHISPNLSVITGLLLLAAAGLVFAYSIFFLPRSSRQSNVAATVPTPAGIPAVTPPSPTSAPPPSPSPTLVPAPSPRATEAVLVIPTDVPASSPTPTPTAPTAAQASPTATSAPATATPKPTRTPKPKPTATPTPPAGAVVARITTTSAAGVIVKADGRTVFSSTIQPGDIREFGADANLYVSSRSATSVLVAVNGCAEQTLDSYACPGCSYAYYNFPRTYRKCR